MELNYTADFRHTDDLPHTGLTDGWRQLRGSWSLSADGLASGVGTDKLQIAQTAFELGRQFTVEATVSVNPPGGIAYDGIAFNISDLGDGTQNGYVLTISYGSPSTWGLFEITRSEQLILPAFGQIDLVPGQPYNLQATAERYGWFKITISDQDTVLVSHDVQLNPLRRRLAGGFFGAFSMTGDEGGPFRIHKINCRTTSERSDPRHLRNHSLWSAPA